MPADPSVPAAIPVVLPPIHRDRQYQRLWSVGMLVGLTRWAESLAFAVFTYEVTQSTLWVAGLMTLRMLPLALFGLSLGALAVRMSRRKMLLVAYAAMLATNLGLLLLSVFGQIEVWHLAAASAMSGTLWAGDMPLRRGLMGDIAGPARVAKAMSLDGVATSACRLIGPGLGGLLLAQAGLPGVFLFSALLYLPMLWLLSGLREPHLAPVHAKRSLAALLVGGFQAARESPQLLATLWLTILFNLFAWPVLSMVPVIGKEVFELDAQGVGLLASVDGVGALLGALLLASVGTLRHGRLFLGAVLSFMALQMLLAWSPQLLVTAAALLAVGMAQAAFGAMQATLAYTASPERRRAEAMGLVTMCIGVSPLGFMGVGALAERFGVATAIFVCALCGLLAVALTWPLCRACLQEPALAPGRPGPDYR
jgi:MFS family permease